MSLRIALGVDYEGSNYFGFQKQKATHQTIQGHLESSISKVADQEVKTYCSGRTDAGVHALLQVIHFDTTSSRSEFEWIRGINSYLPSDIRVLWSKEVSESFHARFSAISRCYQYKIYNDKIFSGLWTKRSLFVTQNLDIASMQKASEYLLGEHDFSSFRGSGCQSKTAIREVEDIKVIKKDNLIIIEIQANAFLLHMVRIIVGTLLMVAKRELDPEGVRTILNKKDRKIAGKTVSPSGLYFLGPKYPNNFDIPNFKNTFI